MTGQEINEFLTAIYRFRKGTRKRLISVFILYVYLGIANSGP